MSIRSLQTLIAIAEEGGFTAAADRLNVTHAAVSQRMKALEAEMPFPVFDRAGRIPKLTPAGLALVEKARDVVAAHDGLAAAVIGEAALTGELILGAVPTSLSGLLPTALRQLRKRYPDLRIRVVPGLSLDLIAEVDRGRLDAAVATPPLDGLEPLSFRPIAQEPLELIASAETVGNDPNTLLKTHPYIRFSRRALVGAMIETWLKRNNIIVREAMELDTLESISAMVHQNLGVSIVPRPCIAGPNSLNLRTLPLGSPGLVRQIGVVSRQDSLKVRLLDALDTVLRDVVSTG